MTIIKQLCSILLLLLLGSCVEQKTPLTPAQISARADTLYREKLVLMKKQYSDDLDLRLAIELRPKIDSIIKQRQAPPPPPPPQPTKMNPSIHAEP